MDIWICYYTQCHIHFDRRDCKYQISFEGCHRRNISGKSNFKTALFVGRFIIFSPLDWSGFWIRCSYRCDINAEWLRSEKKHAYQKLYFPNNRSPNFRSIRYCSDIGRFNRWMYVNFGYVILMMIMYNSTVWIYWILNLQNDVLSLVWEILNENMRFSIKSRFWD